MTNYKAMADRVRACRSASDFQKVSDAMDRLYLAGQLTANELRRLDDLMVDRMVEKNL